MAGIPWQTVSEPDGAEGLPTVGVTVIFVDAGAEGPPQPFAVTLTVAVPLNVVFQVTVPEFPEPLMVPAADEDIDQL